MLLFFLNNFTPMTGGWGLGPNVNELPVESSYSFHLSDGSFFVCLLRFLEFFHVDRIT